MPNRGQLVRIAVLAAVGWAAIALVVFVGLTAYGRDEAPSVAQNTAGALPSPTASGRGPSGPATPQPGAPSAATENGSTLALSQEQVNQQVTRMLQQQGSAAPVRGVNVTLLNDNRIRATGQATLAGQGEIPLAVDLALKSREGKLQVDIASASSGIVPIPVALVTGVVQQALKDTPYRDLSNISLPPEIESVQVEQGRLLIRMR